jgi:hypothetical protein
MTTPYEIKVCPRCGQQTDRWCYEHGPDMIAGERVEVVPADAYRGAVKALRAVSDSAIRDPQPHSSAWLIPAGAMDLVRHHLPGGQS